MTTKRRKKESKSEVLPFRLTPTLKDQLVQAAAEDGITTSSLVTMVLTKWTRDRARRVK